MDDEEEVLVDRVQCIFLDRSCPIIIRITIIIIIIIGMLQLQLKFVISVMFMLNVKFKRIAAHCIISHIMNQESRTLIMRRRRCGRVARPSAPPRPGPSDCPSDCVLSG